MHNAGRIFLLLIAACVWTLTLSAEARFPVAGGFGFDWLKPESARCAPIAAAVKLRTCEFHESGAFGLELAYHSCRFDRDSELLVFKSAAQCQEALETMQANAP